LIRRRQSEVELSSATKYWVCSKNNRQSAPELCAYLSSHNVSAKSLPSRVIKSRLLPCLENRRMTKIIAIGGSAGGLEALRIIAARLPQTLTVPVLVTEHIGKGPSHLPAMLNKAGPLRAHHAVHGEQLKPGEIYVAPPDYHLRVNDGRVDLSHGPKENWARPAVDPMFRSVASAYGPGATGVVLSGSLNDGTAGLYEIKRNGGNAVVQDPKSAANPGMPRSAIENVAVDYHVPSSAIAEVLVRLVAEEMAEPVKPRPTHGTSAMIDAAYEMMTPSALTCAECGGALREEQIGQLTQFRCHIGHVMSSEVLAAQQVELLENSIDAVVRALNEREALCREMADKAAARGQREAAAAWRTAQTEALARKDTMAKLAALDWNRPERAIESIGAEDK
jgi:two-component system chemotaxis response regulator CheB